MTTRHSATLNQKQGDTMNTNPSIGPSSVLGWLTFAGFEITAVTTAATGSQAELNGPGKWTAICGLAALALTSAGRYLQSHGMIRSASPAAQAIGDSAAVLNALQAEARGNVAKLAASPDGVDSANVPFSGAQPAA
jgi:hypothetical protein